MTIGDRIRLRRERLSMSQDELAKKLGYKGRSSISKLEKDASGLPQSKIASIARALNTTPEYIMGWVEESQERSVKDELIDLISGMTPEQIDKVKSFINFIKSGG